MNENLTENLICEYEFEFARERKDTNTIQALKAGLITLSKVKKSTLVALACRIGGFHYVADIPLWNKCAGESLKSWYRTLLDRQQVLNQNGSVKVNKYSEIMKRKALQDLIQSLKSRRDLITVRQLYSNKLLTMFLDGQNKAFSCPALKDIEAELEIVQSLSNQYISWDEEGTLKKNETKNDYKAGLEELKSEMEAQFNDFKKKLNMRN